MNRLRKLGLASFFFLGLGLVSGALPRSATGWLPGSALTLPPRPYKRKFKLMIQGSFPGEESEQSPNVSHMFNRTPSNFNAQGEIARRAWKRVRSSAIQVSQQPDNVQPYLPRGSQA